MRHLLAICLSLFLCLFLVEQAGATRGVRILPNDTLQITDSITMSELVVAAATRPVSMKGDTLVYDVASFPLAEGSRLRELLKRLPGVEVTSEGVIRAQGRVVTRILLNGKDFFASNKSVALDNLPAEVLTKIKVYDKVEESDAEMGLRGSTEKVIDVTTKPDKDNGWFCDLAGGGGTEERYMGNVSLSQFNNVWQNMLSVAADNLPGTFGIGDSYYEKLTREPSTGDTDRRSYNLVMGRTKGAWEVNGTAYLNAHKGVNGSRSLLESYLENETSYTATTSESESEGRSLNSSLTVEWRDSLTSFSLEPTFDFGAQDYLSAYRSSTYDADPYRFEYPPFGQNFNTAPAHIVNYNRNESEARERNYSLHVKTRLTRRLSRRGNSLRVELAVENGRTWGEELNMNHVVYFRHRVSEPTLRHTDHPQRTLQLRGRLTYVHPLTSRLKLLLEYGADYRRQRMEQPVYSLDRRMSSASGLGPHPIVSPATYRDSLSRFATNVYTRHRAKALLQYAHNNLHLTVGVQANPQRTDTRYRRFRMEVDTARTVMNWTPEFSFYYKRNNTWNISLQYTGTTAQPDLFYLLPIPEDSDPLNRRTGNPGLRPSFTHSLSLTFFYFRPEMQRQLSLSAAGNVVQNAMTQLMYYHATSGTRFYKPMNVNGNRSWSGTWSMGTSFVEHPEWYVDMQGELSVVRDVGLQAVTHDEVMPDETAHTEYTTHHLNVQNYLGIQWQKGALSMKPYAYASYAALRSSLSGAEKRDVWVFGYGMVTRWESDCGVSLAADVYNHSRRGFIGNDLNSNEFICDAEVAYSFLKGRAATVRLQGCDLLGQRALTRGYMGVSGRKETAYTHSTNSYVLLSFSYRFSLFGVRWPWGKSKKG